MRYSGEQYDSDLGQQYLRARYYNQQNGQFNRLDPYSGNIEDPQSYNKYGYCHNDPVNGIDPSGEMLAAVMADIGLRGMLRSIYVGPAMGTFFMLQAKALILPLVSFCVAIGANHIAPIVLSKAAEIMALAARATAKAASKALREASQRIFPVFESIMPHIYKLTLKAQFIYGKSKILTYQRGVAKANRRAAIGGKRHLYDVDAGLNSLDEYPYASTSQGGYGSHVEAVPKRENNIQGGMLSAFYRLVLRERKLFLVLPIPDELVNVEFAKDDLLGFGFEVWGAAQQEEELL